MKYSQCIYQKTCRQNGLLVIHVLFHCFFFKFSTPVGSANECIVFEIGILKITTRLKFVVAFNKFDLPQIAKNTHILTQIQIHSYTHGSDLTMLNFFYGSYYLQLVFSLIADYYIRYEMSHIIIIIGSIWFEPMHICQDAHTCTHFLIILLVVSYVSTCRSFY